MRRAILAGAVATTVLSGAAAGVILGVPAAALSGERPASTPKVSIAAATIAAAAAGVPAPAAAVQPDVAAAAPAPAAAPAAAIAHAKLSSPASIKAKIPENTDPAGTGGELAVVASALHMALSNLKAALAEGESLAQIAKSAGVDPATLIATVMDDATKKINAALARGKLARAQADKIMAMLPNLVTDAVNHGFGDIGAGFGDESTLPFSMGSLGDLANLGNFANLGNPANLGNLANMGNMANLTNLANMGSTGNAADFGNFFKNMFGSFGKMGGQAGAGKTPDPQALISSLVSMATAAVNAAQTAGLLSATQAATILSSLTQTITTLVHHLLDASHNLESDAKGWASLGSSWMSSWMGHHDH